MALYYCPNYYYKAIKLTDANTNPNPNPNPNVTLITLLNPNIFVQVVDTKKFFPEFT